MKRGTFEKQKNLKNKVKKLQRMLVLAFLTIGCLLFNEHLLSRRVDNAYETTLIISESTKKLWSNQQKIIKAVIILLEKAKQDAQRKGNII